MVRAGSVGSLSPTMWAGEAGPLSRNQHDPVFTGKGRQQECGSQLCVPRPGTHDAPEAGAPLQVRKGGTWTLPRHPILEGTPLPAEELPQDRGQRRRKTGPESSPVVAMGEPRKTASS